MVNLSILSGKGVKWIGIGWTAFLAENLVVSENREYLINNLGDQNYHLLYNSLSTMASGSILYGYYRYRKTGFSLPKPGKTRMFIGFVLQSIGVMGLSQLFPKLQSPYIKVDDEISSQSPSPSPSSSSTSLNSSKMKMRCPMDFRPKDIPANGIYGMDRISRHPTFWSLGILCLGQASMATYVPEIIMFTYPILFASIGGWHQDQRYLRGSGGYLSKENYSITSNVPFIALATGKQSWSDLAKEIKWSNAFFSLFLSSSIFILKKI